MPSSQGHFLGPWTGLQKQRFAVANLMDVHCWRWKDLENLEEEVVESPSVEVFKKHMDMALKDMV